MVRRVIQIDEEKCNGCGICAEACHEGAIGIVDGKAKLLRDDYCDGLGDCLPNCPVGAISLSSVRQQLMMRQPYRKIKRKNAGDGTGTGWRMPGSRMRQLERKPAEENQNAGSPVSSQLRQWPVQIKLAPVNAPYFDGAKLLIAADCTAYAYGSFHQDFIRGKVTLIGCPKLDDVDYSEKLTEIIRNNDIKSVTVVRMEVPCCGGLEHAAVTALKNSGKFIPWNVVTISIDGKILD